MIQINNGNGRVSAWGMASDVKFIRWVRPPDLLPQVGSRLDLTGAAIYGVFEDGTEQEITEHCSFQPSQHAYIPNEKFITVTAYYVSKSGKTHSADISLPVCYPAELRLTVNGTPLYENYLYTESPDFDPDTMPLRKGTFKPYCVWKRINPRTEEEVTIRIAPVPEENMFYIYNPEQNGSDVFRTYGGDDEVTWVISSVENPKQDVTNWHEPFTPTVESFERPLVIRAQAHIGVVNLSATAYIETRPIKLTYVNLPTTFADGVPTRLTKDNIRFSWGGSTPVAPVTGLNDMWIGIALAGSEPPIGYYDEVIYTFENGEEHDLYAVRRNPAYYWGGPSDEPNEYTRYHGVCENNRITWTEIEE